MVDGPSQAGRSAGPGATSRRTALKAGLGVALGAGAQFALPFHIAVSQWYDDQNYRVMQYRIDGLSAG